MVNAPGKNNQVLITIMERGNVLKIPLESLAALGSDDTVDNVELVVDEVRAHGAGCCWEIALGLCVACMHIPRPALRWSLVGRCPVIPSI
jgi:hypothetical protein